MTEIRGTTGMLSQAEQGLKLFEAQKNASNAEYDKAEAEKYKQEIEEKVATLESQAGRTLTVSDCFWFSIL